MERKAGIRDVPDRWNQTTEAILRAAIEVHSILGPGLLERLYEQALGHELRLAGLRVQTQVPIRVSYKGVSLGDQFIDLLIEDLVVVELKAVDRVSEVHLAQLTSYLRSSGYPLGLLLNFNVARLKDGIFRRVHSGATPTPLSMLDPDLPPRHSAPSAPPAFSSSHE